MAELVERLVSVWTSQGISLRQGVRSEDIQQFERKWRIRMPRKLTTYFLRVDGMAPGEYDEQMIRFWPLSELKPAVPELRAIDVALYADEFLFADHSIWAHVYVINLGSLTYGRVAIGGGGFPIPVAKSFGDFLERYLNDPDSIFKVEPNSKAANGS
jgi:hypothetical protein